MTQLHGQIGYTAHPEQLLLLLLLLLLRRLCLFPLDLLCQHLEPGDALLLAPLLLLLRRLLPFPLDLLCQHLEPGDALLLAPPLHLSCNPLPPLSGALGELGMRTATWCTVPSKRKSMSCL